MFKKIKPYALPLFAIFVLQLITLWPSFKLALFGDDWLAFWRYWTIVDANVYHLGYNTLTYFLTPYGPQDITMGVLRKIFEFNSTPYYIVSFVFRLIASSTIYVVFFKLTKNKLGAFMSGLFFAVSPIGMDTTNWVFNMPSYIGIAFLVVFYYFYVQSRRDDKLSKLVLGYVFLFLAIVVVPIRMAGVIPLTFLTELFWFISNRKKNVLIKSTIRIVLFLAIFLLIKNIGHSFADPQESIRRFKVGMDMLNQFVLMKQQPEVILYPITIFGNMIFPETLWNSVGKYLNISIFGRVRPFPVFGLLMFSIFLFLCSKYLLVDKKNGAKHFVVAAILGFVFNVIVWIFYKISPATFTSYSTFGATLIGGFTLLFFFCLLFSREIIKQKWNLSLFSMTIWPIAFILMPWSFIPNTNYPAVHRYMVVSSVGVAFIFGSLVLTKFKKPILLIILFAYLYFSQFKVTYNFLYNLSLRQGQEIANKVWDPVYKELPKNDIGKLYVVYLQSDTHNGDIVYNNVFFGLNPRMSILSNIVIRDNIPFAITTYDDLVSMVTDGKALFAQGHKTTPIGLDQIYAFRIVGDTPDSVVVTNITDVVVKDLEIRRSEYEKNISNN